MYPAEPQLDDQSEPDPTDPAVYRLERRLDVQVIRPRVLPTTFQDTATAKPEAVAYHDRGLVSLMIHAACNHA